MLVVRRQLPLQDPHDDQDRRLHPLLPPAGGPQYWQAIIKNWDSLETNPAIHFDWVVWVDWVFTLISVIRSREKIKNIIWRYISIKSPLVSLNWSSQRKRARRMVITAWILTILFSSPQAVIFRSTTLFILKIPNFNQNLQNLCK